MDLWWVSLHCQWWSQREDSSALVNLSRDIAGVHNIHACAMQCWDSSKRLLYREPNCLLRETKQCSSEWHGFREHQELFDRAMIRCLVRKSEWVHCHLLLFRSRIGQLEYHDCSDKLMGDEGRESARDVWPILMNRCQWLSSRDNYRSCLSLGHEIDLWFDWTRASGIIDHFRQASSVTFNNQFDPKPLGLQSQSISSQLRLVHRQTRDLDERLVWMAQP